MDRKEDERWRELTEAIGRTEFFAEQALAYFKFPSDMVLSALSLFEIGKLFFRTKRYFMSKQRFLMSEETTVSQDEENLIKKEKHIQNLFFKEFNPSKGVPVDIENMKAKITKALGNLKPSEDAYKNPIYKDKLNRSNLNMNIISNLPVPEKVINGGLHNKKNQFWVKFGEILNLLRPLIYCFAMMIFGVDSYKPYFLSLAIDLLRFLLHRKVPLHDPKEVQELKSRKVNLIINYLIRNPVYGQILKPMVIEPLLNKIFPGKLSFLKTVALYFIEFRCSLSLLMQLNYQKSYESS